MLPSPPVRTMAERDNSGRFPKGVSGNRRGRPKSQHRRIETLEDCDETTISVMNTQTTIRTPDGDRSVTLFEANLLRLATGKADNRLAANLVIQVMRQALAARDQRVQRKARYLTLYGTGE